MRNDDIVERALGNGWYELGTMVESMGETYIERRRYDHKPTDNDYARFLQIVESNK